MPELQAQRRLVKSPPELWAEVSDAAALARHLGEVGEITITRVEQESTVAWEGERASGTVQLEPAGWGTRVTLTAQPAAENPEVAPAAEAVASVAEPPAPQPEPEPAPQAEPPVPEPPATAEEPAGRPSLLRRLFGRRAPQPAPVVSPEPPEPVAAEREPVVAEPEPPAAVAEPKLPAPEPADDALQAVLTAALDSLGAAHHRPFSRG